MTSQWRSLLDDVAGARRFIDERRGGHGANVAAQRAGFERYTSAHHVLWYAWLRRDLVDPPKPPKARGGKRDGEGEWREMLRFIRDVYVPGVTAPTDDDRKAAGLSVPPELDFPGVYFAWTRPDPTTGSRVVTGGKSAQSAYKRALQQGEKVLMMWRIEPLYLDLFERMLLTLMPRPRLAGQRDLWWYSEVEDILARLRRLPDTIIPDEL